MIILLLGHSAHAAGDHTKLPAATDLQRDGKAAAVRQLVVLLAVTREGCPYCARLKHEVLAPMIRSGEYDDKVLIRELMMEPESDLIDFAGQAVSSAELAARYSVEITPTVLLLDHAGAQLHPPIPGINTTEMYSFYLDRAIEQALAAAEVAHTAEVTQE